MIESYKRTLVEYFKKNLSKGYNIDVLKIALTNQGYSKDAVEKASKQALTELVATAPVLKETSELENEPTEEETEPVKERPWWKFW
jgi:hypothetical protein